jgi:gluconate 5-dehydrogenase
VSGASRGIGLAIARAMAAAGARVILGARTGQRLEADVEEIRANGGIADAHVFDATDAGDVTRLSAALPPFDVLVNVVGTNVRKPFLSYAPSEVDALMRTNLASAMDVTRALGGPMVARGQGGKVLFVGSLVVHIGVPNVSIYAATKGALTALTRALAAEWAPAGIQVNCIIPGMILTELNRDMWASPAMRDWLRTAQANPRLGRPEDVAPLAVFLAGPGADYITGQLIAVDGGYTTTKMWPFGGDE